MENNTKKKPKLTKVLVIILISLIVLAGAGLAYLMLGNKSDENQVVTHSQEEYEQIRREELPITKTYYLRPNETLLVDEIEDFDENIILYDGKYAKAASIGETTYYDLTSNIKNLIVVTDLYDEPHIDNEKEFIPCHAYSQEEASLLDGVLRYEIDEAGFRTRAGALQAVRFLTLEFKYRLNYFCENGRLETHDELPLCDGEGRYYHYGLYLTDDKFGALYASQTGPATWGCDLYENPEEQINQNGIDCSGLITWALYNAGFDCGDIGGGYNEDDDILDLLDLGEVVELTELNYEDLKAGDLIGFPGHIGMVIGIDNENVYVAHSYWDNGLEIKTYTHEELLDSNWEYVVLMDSYYQNDGNYSSMW